MCHAFSRPPPVMPLSPRRAWVPAALRCARRLWRMRRRAWRPPALAPRVSAACGAAPPRRALPPQCHVSGGRARACASVLRTPGSAKGSAQKARPSSTPPSTCSWLAAGCLIQPLLMPRAAAQQPRCSRYATHGDLDAAWRRAALRGGPGASRRPFGRDDFAAGPVSHTAPVRAPCRLKRGPAAARARRLAARRPRGASRPASRPPGLPWCRRPRRP